MKKVSIIIPVYNGEKHIEDCIKKILKQTYNNIEIIVINDGSTDNTKSIIEQYSITDSRIQVINKKNTGVSDSRNIGIDKAKGDYILFLDSDDELENNTIQCLINSIEKNTNCIDMILFGFKVQGTCNRYNDTLILKYIKSNPDIKNELLHRMIAIKDNIYGYIWRALYSKSMLEREKIRFPKGIKISEDYMFLLDSIKSSNEILIDENEYYIYKINESSMSIKYIPTLLHDMLYVNNWMYEEIVKKDTTFIEGYNFCMCNTYLRYVQTVIRDKEKKLVSKIREVYLEKQKNNFMSYLKLIPYKFNKYNNKKTYISFFMFRLNLDVIYMVLFDIKEKIGGIV